MPNGDDVIDTAKEAILVWLYLADSERSAKALKRFANSPQAHNGWQSLAAKKLQKGSLWEVAHCIGRLAINSQLQMAEKRTGREIKEAAREASSLARRLIKLIQRNATLRAIPLDLLPVHERAALNRILGGLISQKVENNRRDRVADPDEFFAPGIERELDAIQTRNYPESSPITTSVAYRILTASEFDENSFLGQLIRFAEFAEASANAPPVVPNPKRASTSQHVFALSACSTLADFYGSPNCEVVADFASAVFDTTVDTASVKKWWQRRSQPWAGDKSGEET